jgi:uncharacterized protein
LNEQIEQLVSLQMIDLEIDKIDEGIHLEQKALDDRISALAEKEAGILSLQERIELLEKKQRTLDSELTDKMAHVKDRQSKMMQVQTGREQTALLKEIEDAKKSAKENEDQIVAILEEIEELKSKVEGGKNQLKTEKGLVAEETEKVRKTINAINKGKKSKTEERNKQSQEIDPNLLRKYTTLRERRNGLAVVNVLQGVCQGCFMSVPPQQYNMLLKGDRLFDCPTCQRIMYHQALETETE